MLFRKPLILVTLSCALGASRTLADAPGDDMLKPDEIKTEGVSSNPANDSGPYVGGGLAFGQGRTTEEGGSPGVAYLLKVEPGYQINRGTWSRIEVGAELFSGVAAFRTGDDNLGKVTASVPFGLLVKVGYGYSLGEKMFGVARLGLGPVTGKIEADVSAGEYKSDTLTGTAVQLGWLMVMPTGGAIDVTGGLAWTHMQFDVDKLEGVDVDRTVIVNVPAVEVGLRVRL